MTDHRRLHELLSDAVADVEPRDRIAEIRERTQTKSGRPRSRWYAVGGAVLATAAAVTVVAVVGSTLRGPSDGPGPGVTATETSPPEERQAVPAYYVGETPRGPRLYRGFVDTDADVPVLEASLDALEGTPGDPDYTSYWRDGAFAGASAVPDDSGGLGVIYVELADPSLRDLPTGLDPAEAELAVQQVIYSVQGALEKGRWPVQFRYDDNPIDQVYGVPTSEPLSNAPLFDVLSLMSISYPFEGAEVNGSFVADGANNGFEVTMEWTIERDGEVLLEGYASTGGYLEERLYPWKTEPIDVSGLEPGGYEFIASNPDPSGGAEGSGPDSDTRTIFVE